MVSLKNIITHILQAHGFEAYERDGVLRGEKEGMLVTVGLFDEVTVQQLRAHARYVSHEDGNHIVCALEATDTAEEEARKLGLDLWKKSDLEEELGLVIADRIRAGGSLFSGLVEPIPRNAGEAPITIECLGTEGEPGILKSNLTLEDVKEIAGNTIQGFKYELEYVPYYIFRYACTYGGKDGQIVQREGRISVNALTGKYGEWANEPEFETGQGHVIQLEPKIDHENARKIAYHAIITLNTEYKEIIMEKDHATIIERATFRPDMESIDLEDASVIMVPVWCAEGKHGVMILDGINGKVISEDYYGSH